MMTASAIEPLEPRIAPALAITLVDGTLNISGDFNNIRLDIHHSASSTVVSDFDSTLGTFTGVQAVAIKLGGEGTVRANFAPAKLDGDFRFKSTGKLDLEFTNNSMIGGNVKIVGHLTDEKVQFGNGSDISGNTLVRAGGGSDSVSLGSGSVFRGNVFVDMGDGDNAFAIQSGTITGNLTVLQGNGWDTFYFGIAGAVNVGGSLFVAQGGGNDLMRTSGGGLSVGGDFTYRGGGGNDRLFVSAQVSGTVISIKMGGGDDAIAFEGTAPNATVKIAMGKGNDNLAGSLWTFMPVKRVVFDGGPGNDYLAEAVSSILADSKKVQNFEVLS